MYKKLATAVLTLAALSQAAVAADLPVRSAPALLPPPVFSWTGLYFGGQIGGDFAESNARLYNATTGATVGTNGSDPTGLIAGFHVGYHYEAPPSSFFGTSSLRPVIGLEGDIDGTTARTDYVIANFVNDTTSQPLQGSFVGHVGVAADHLLVYGLGGLAFAYQRDNYRSTLLGGVANEINEGRVGFTVGGGVDYAVTDHLSLRVEYKFTQFGSFSESLPLVTPLAADNVTRRETNSRVQAGISYKIDPPTPVPVVARY